MGHQLHHAELVMEKETASVDAIGASETVEVTYVQGVEGNSIYINDYRVAGPKPWGGGQVLKCWKSNKDDILRAIGVDAIQREEGVKP